MREIEFVDTATVHEVGKKLLFNVPRVRMFAVRIKKILAHALQSLVSVPKRTNEEGVMRKKLAAAIILSSAFGGASASVAQQQTMPGQSAPGSANPPIQAPREVLPSNPGQVAPKQPDFQQTLPGQQGTIPEIVERPGAMNPMVVSPQEVRKAQETLKAKGYDPGPASGTLDTRTQEALRKFQQDNNLLATGVLDDKTASQLGIDIKQKSDTNKPGQTIPEKQTR